MKDCTVFHSNCGPLGPFFELLNNAGQNLLPFIRTLNLIDAAKVTQFVPYRYLKS